MCLIWAAAVLLCVSAGGAMAATSFTADFSSGVFSDALRNPNDNSGNPAYAIDNGVLLRATYEQSRAYVTTTASDFNTVDFTATLVYNPEPVGGGGWADHFYFGIGSGEPSNIYNEPATALYFDVYINYGSHLPNQIVVQVNYRPGIDNEGFKGSLLTTWWGDPGPSGVGVASGTTGALQIAMVDGYITFGWDLTNSGTLDISQTLSVPLAEWCPELDSTNSHIFFGSGHPSTTFSRLTVTVVPEPATMTLLALGGLTILRRRR